MIIHHQCYVLYLHIVKVILQQIKQILNMINAPNNLTHCNFTKSNFDKTNILQSNEALMKQVKELICLVLVNF